VDGGLNRNLHTLLDRGLFVVLGHDARLGEQFADALGFGCGDEEVESEVRRTRGEAEAAGRSLRAEVDVERNTGGSSVAGRLTAGNAHRGSRNAGACGDAAAADCWRTAVERTAAGGGGCKAEFGTDVLRERAGCGDDASFDFNLLRLAIELAEQIVDIRNDRRNVVDDE